MVELTGQTNQPCVEIDGVMLADVSGEEVENYLKSNNLVEKMIKNLQCLSILLAQMKNIVVWLKKVHRLSDFLKQFIHLIMSYVVTEKCVDCKFTSCVSVCPVDA